MLEVIDRWKLSDIRGVYVPGGWKYQFSVAVRVTDYVELFIDNLT